MSDQSAQKPQKVTKAVIAAAGFGTRFLPQTKAMPKEMMPVVDKPIIQYVVEELVEAGIKDIIIIGSSNKRSIEDHFDIASEDLLNNLRAGGDKKKHLLDEMDRIANLANFIYLRQKGPYGNATPILNAAHLIGDEPFIYKWADDFFRADVSSTKQLIETYEKYGGSVLACKRVLKDDEYDKFGIVDGAEIEPGILDVTRIIEKPGKQNAPSTLASVSNYLFTPSMIAEVEKLATRFSGGGELVMQPAIQAMLENGEKVYAREVKGGTFCDTGDKLEYLKTVFDFALAHDELGPQLREYLLEKYRQSQKTQKP